jgi:hypothetical protein
LLVARGALAAAGPRGVRHTFRALAGAFDAAATAASALGPTNALAVAVARDAYDGSHESAAALAIAGHTAFAIEAFSKAALGVGMPSGIAEEFLSQGKCCCWVRVCECRICLLFFVNPHLQTLISPHPPPSQLLFFLKTSLQPESRPQPFPASSMPLVRLRRSPLLCLRHWRPAALPLLPASLQNVTLL